MNQTMILALIALGASIYLLLNQRARLWAVIATVVSGVMVAMGFGLLQLSIAGVDLGVVLGGALAVAGGLLFFAVREKFRVAAATAVTLAGILLLLESLHLS